MSGDFFSSVPLRRSPSQDDPAHDDFAHAISLRFGSTDLRTARLLPGDLAPHHPAPPLPQPPSPLPPPPPPRAPSPPHSFLSVPPSTLALFLSDPHSLILDIRPHAAHAAARINNALSLSVPTTLLKRPLFSLSKLSQMLPSPSSRARFADWSSASRILVYDSDSTSSPDNSIIAGLLRKFRAEGFPGELGWLCGGFQAVWKEVGHLTTTEPLSPEDDDPDVPSSSGTLRTTHLPRAAFSLSSTTAAHPPQPGLVLGSNPLPDTPAPRAANPFFDTIRQNIELSHGVTERIPLRLPRRVRRRIHELPSRWLQDIARRSAVNRASASRHPGLDSLESGSESSDDPHTSDPDENDPDVEEGAETLAMQFYRIELAEQRRLRSIMEHHTRESQISTCVASVNPRGMLHEDTSGVSVRIGAMSVPGTPHPTAFPFSITAAVEKGTKNRYTHIWPFEHARVRLHDGRHQDSHSGRRDKSKASERGRSAKDRSGGKAREKEEQRQEQDKQRRSRSSPAISKVEDQGATEVISTPSRNAFYFGAKTSTAGTSLGFETRLVHSILGAGPNVPQVKIEYDTTEQDFRTSGPPTPSTALPLPTPPFYTPMEILPMLTPMRLQPPPMLSLPSGVSVSPGGRLEGTQVASNQLYPESLPSFPLLLPNRPGRLLPSIGEQTRTSSLPTAAAPFGAYDGEVGNGSWMLHRPRREPSPVDDYVNASYVQPLCTRKRYIATQGPLPSTYVDFWTLVWEQNVHVIVMLTREVENAMVKCGSYWTDAEYGPLRLKIVSTSPPLSPSVSSTDMSKQGFFAIREPQRKTSGASSDQPTLITRTFLLSHTSYPGVPPRKITHLQYLDWSDMNVPDDPWGVLDLVKKVEQAVAESTPGPSPGGSLSPGSASGSLSGSQSPDAGPDQKGHDTSLLSPTSAGFMPWGRRARRGSEWRHPELDPKSGIAAFALGKEPPVLLHCSAGVGRTGGFIAVDAVLDGIRTELRKNREERELKKTFKVGVVLNREDKARVSDFEAGGDGELSIENTETGANSGSCGGEDIADGSERMDVDESTTDNAEKTQAPLNMFNTVPIHVSAGDRTKSRRRRHGKDSSGEKQSSSQESLVVHVPYAGTDDILEGADVTDIGFGDAKEADWKSSTREWVAKVSDRTQTHTEERSLPPPPLFPPSRRGTSPGSTSDSSDPSGLNSADDSMSGGASVDVSRSTGVRSGVENRERNSDAGSASGSGTGSGSGHPPQSSASKQGSGSVSLSTSGSGTGTNSRFGSSLLGSSLRGSSLRDSSVTSVSVESTDSGPPQCEPELATPLHRPPAVHINSSSDMEVDCPPRPVSVPFQPASRRARHDKRVHKPSSGARLTSPLATLDRSFSFFGSDAAEGPTSSRPSSDPGSDEVTSPPPELESGESVDESRKSSQEPFDESDELTTSSKSKTNLWLNTDLSTLMVPETPRSGTIAKNAHLPSRQAQGNRRASPLAPRAPDDLAPPQVPTASGDLGASENEQHATDPPVIDYKLPRELHIDSSPPPISSFEDPICAIIQDMREQRMSLCQSLRQYIFVHAAVIEGALRIVDEEHELWGYSWTSDEASSAEGEGASVKKGLRETEGVRLGGAEGVFMRLEELEHNSISHRTRTLQALPQLLNLWSSGGIMGSGRALGPASSSSGVPSPLKGKRAPSPTELLREDKTGALSLNKRPSIHRQRTGEEGDQFPFELRKSSPVAGENGEGSGSVVGMGATRPALGRLALPEKGGPASGGR